MTLKWKNWSGLHTSSPKQMIMPKNRNALVFAIQQHAKIRVVGAGHSFSPLVKTEDTLLSLDHLQGLINSDVDECSAEIWAGTRIHQLPKILDPIDQALKNQGDIDQQSIAGAVATGTHGTGANLQCLSAMVSSFELVTAQGDVLKCDDNQNSEIFQAGRVALGSLGVLTKVKLENRPRYKLKEHIRLCSIQDILTQMDTWKDQHRHIESFVFPYHDKALLKTLDETDENIQPKPTEWPSEDTLLTLCCELTKLIPASVVTLQKLVSLFIKESYQVNWSAEVFPSVRNTKFNEMEYQIPIEKGMQCLEEVIATFRKKHLPAFFPIEVRYVKGDDIWLSPFYQQDSLSISVHQYAKQDCQKIFAEIEPIFWRYGGRPHWGKLHNLSAHALAKLYPKWCEFQQLREVLDPQQKFLNPYLHHLFIEG